MFSISRPIKAIKIRRDVITIIVTPAISHAYRLERIHSVLFSIHLETLNGGVEVIVKGLYTDYGQTEAPLEVEHISKLEIISHIHRRRKCY